MLKISCYIFFVLCLVLTVIEGNTNTCPTIKTKRNWGGLPSVCIDYQPFPVNYVIIHHTVTPTCSTYAQCSEQVADIQSYHMKDLGRHDIAYNFLIGNDGNVYEGVGWHKIGTHALDYSNKSIGIAFMGNFNDELPTVEALEAGKKLLDCGVEKGELGRHFRLLGARQIRSTQSPGLTLYNEIQDWDNWVSNP